MSLKYCLVLERKEMLKKRINEKDKGMSNGHRN